MDFNNLGNQITGNTPSTTPAMNTTPGATQTLSLQSLLDDLQKSGQYVGDKIQSGWANLANDTTTAVTDVKNVASSASAHAQNNLPELTSLKQKLESELATVEQKIHELTTQVNVPASAPADEPLMGGSRDPYYKKYLKYKTKYNNKLRKMNL